MQLFAYSCPNAPSNSNKLRPEKRAEMFYILKTSIGKALPIKAEHKESGGSDTDVSLVFVKVIF